jgi:hypothetical protein
MVRHRKPPGCAMSSTPCGAPCRTSTDWSVMSGGRGHAESGPFVVLSRSRQEANSRKSPQPMRELMLICTCNRDFGITNPNEFIGAASCTSKSRVDRRTRNASIRLALQPSKGFWQNEPNARFRVDHRSRRCQLHEQTSRPDTRNASISLELQPSKGFWQNEPNARFAGQPPISGDR